MLSKVLRFDKLFKRMKLLTNVYTIIGPVTIPLFGSTAFIKTSR